MSLEIIVSLATAIILLLLFVWLLQVLKSTIKAVLLIGGILILLQLGLGISSEQIIQTVAQTLESIRVFIVDRLSAG